MNQIGTVITLCTGEQEICKVAARARGKIARASNVKDLKVSGEDGFLIDLEGFGAEMAFCKLNNLFPDFSHNIKPTGEDLGDAIKDGLRVDIKSTTRKDGHLIAAKWKKPTVDVYAMFTGSFPTYEFRGYLPSCELLRPERLKDFSNGSCFAAKQSELVEWYELWLFAQNR